MRKKFPGSLEVKLVGFACVVALVANAKAFAAPDVAHTRNTLNSPAGIHDSVLNGSILFYFIDDFIVCRLIDEIDTGRAMSAACCSTRVQRLAHLIGNYARKMRSTSLPRLQDAMDRREDHWKSR